MLNTEYIHTYVYDLSPDQISHSQLQRSIIYGRNNAKQIFRVVAMLLHILLTKRATIKASYFSKT